MFPETPKTWTARSLEHDLMAAGRTPEGALDSLVKMADAHFAYDLRHGHRPLSSFAAAPQTYWSAFLTAPKKEQPIELTRSEPLRSLSCVVGVASYNPALRRLPTPMRIA